MTPPSPAGQRQRQRGRAGSGHPDRHRRDGSIASFTVNGLPAHGTLYRRRADSTSHPGTRCRPAPDGTDRSLPADPDWNGDTRFPFAPPITQAPSAPTEATITITPVNDAPVARDDHGAVTEGGTPNVLAANGLIASAPNPAGQGTTTWTATSSPLSVFDRRKDRNRAVRSSIQTVVMPTASSSSTPTASWHVHRHRHLRR